MSDVLKDYHKNILNWLGTFKKIPKASIYASFLFFVIGFTGFVLSLMFLKDKPIVMWILLIMGLASGIWFCVMNRKVRRMIKILEDLKIVKDFEVFSELIKSIIKIRKDASVKDKTSTIDELFREKQIKSKDLHLELNRIALDIQRIEAREK